jgi:hypothetical protein
MSPLQISHPGCKQSHHPWVENYKKGEERKPHSLSPSALSAFLGERGLYTLYWASTPLQEPKGSIQKVYFDSYAL